MPPISLVLALLVSVFSFSSASPAALPDPQSDWYDWKQSQCLSDADASLLVDIMVSTSVKFEVDQVIQYFTDDFTLYSDSVNFVLGLPLQTPFVTNRATYLQNAYDFTSTVPQPPTEVQYVTHNCNQITARVLQLDTPNVVAEIYLMDTSKEGGTWKIARLWNEFNSAADAANTAASGGGAE